MTNKHSIDTKKFCIVLDAFYKAAVNFDTNCGLNGSNEQYSTARTSLIAYIDAWRDAQVTPTVDTQVDTTAALIDAAEKHAAAYDDDDRECIKTDVLNAFYAGSAWQARAALAHVAPTAASVSDERALPAMLTMKEAFESVGGSYNGGEAGYPSFGSANALWAYTDKMQRNAVARAHGASSAPADESDQQVAVKFYRDNPSAALFDMNRRIGANAATPASAQPVEAAPADEIDRVNAFAVEVEKLLCAALGKQWGPTSEWKIASLIEELRAAPAAPVAQAYDALDVLRAIKQWDIDGWKERGFALPTELRARIQSVIAASTGGRKCWNCAETSEPCYDGGTPWCTKCGVVDNPSNTPAIGEGVDGAPADVGHDLSEGGHVD